MESITVVLFNLLRYILFFGPIIFLVIRKIIVKPKKPEFVFADFGSRLGAFILDNIIIFVPAQIISAIALLPSFIAIGTQTGPETRSSTTTSSVFPILSLILLIVFPLINIYLQGRYGATVGKMVVKIRCVNGDGKPIGFLRSLMREVLKIGSAAPFFIGFIWMFFEPGRQTFHDLVVKSYVIKKIQ